LSIGTPLRGDEERSAVRRFNKLVRDRIPEIIEAEGKRCEVRELDDAEFARCLDEKLDEELREYQQSGDLSELIDLVEVVQAIVERQGKTWQEFEQLRTAKRAQRGGFTNRLLLVSVEEG
jgi:predicted house-cleaning noncanonical NTP pyrophosphatase (MazG superfamily)